jgi:hypothetical protein
VEALIPSKIELRERRIENVFQVQSVLHGVSVEVSVLVSSIKLELLIVLIALGSP